MNARIAAVRVGLLLMLTALLPACGADSGSGTLTPTVAPAAPTSLKAESSNGRIALSWSPSPAASTYRISRSSGPGGPFAPIPSGQNVTGTSFIDPAIPNGTTAYYQVVAVNRFGESAASVTIQGTAQFSVRLISAGGHHTLAQLADHSVWAWGDNDFGQLGIGTNRDLRTVAVEVPGLPPVTAVAAGGIHSLALAADGTVYVWGSNLFGQLGDPAVVEIALPMQVPGIDAVIAISAGAMHSLALRADGTVWFWGMRGPGGNPLADVPTPVAGLAGVIQISAGEEFNLALKADGSVWAWGDNTEGQLGDGTTTPRPSPVAVANLNSTVAVAAGHGFSAALRSDGTVWAWGVNDRHQLGSDTPGARSLLPFRVPGVEGAAAIAAGSATTVALRSDGTVWAWGANDEGQLGRGSENPFQDAGRVANLTGVASVSAGYAHAAALRTDGTMWTWGAGEKGQLGSGIGEIQPDPIQVSNVTGATAIAAGTVHSLAIENNQSLWGWGSNQTGQLGQTPLQSNFRVPIPGVSTIAGITAGTFFTVARRSNGSLLAWGQNDWGQLGRGSTSAPSSTPTAVQTLDGATFGTMIIQVSAGDTHCLALSALGAVWGWGSNTGSKLGINPVQTQSLTPVQIGLTGVSTLSAGQTHSLAIVGSGAASTVWGWGYDAFKMGSSFGFLTAPTQLAAPAGMVAVQAAMFHSVLLHADGTVWFCGSATGGVFTQVPGLSGIIAISAAGKFTLALDGSGHVWSWGFNDFGELGLGDTEDRTDPEQIPGLSNCVAIATSLGHSLALLSDGRVLAWGDNFSGVIGNGTDHRSSIPVLVTH